MRTFKDICKLLRKRKGESRTAISKKTARIYVYHWLNEVIV